MLSVIPATNVRVHTPLESPHWLITRTSQNIVLASPVGTVLDQLLDMYVLLPLLRVSHANTLDLVQPPLPPALTLHHQPPPDRRVRVRPLRQPPRLPRLDAELPRPDAGPGGRQSRRVDGLCRIFRWGRRGGGGSV